MKRFPAAILAAVVVLAGCGLAGSGDDQADLATMQARREAGATTKQLGAVPTEGEEDSTGSGVRRPDDPAFGVVTMIADLVSSQRVNCRFEQPAPLPIAPLCHDVAVPENWFDPDPDDQVLLHVVVFRGSGNTEDPIIYLDGGPGSNTTETLALSYYGLVDPLLDERDVIVYDQRGVGESRPALTCPELTELTIGDMMGAVDQDEIVDETLHAQRSCANRLQQRGIDLTAYNSIASANDLEAIRIALGYDRFNALGISYGTRLGQTYLRMYPGSLRSLVLDSVFPTEANLWTDFDAGAERAFRRLFDGCASSPECSARFPDFEDDFFTLLDQLDRQPAGVVFTNRLTGASTPGLLTGDDVAALAFQTLYNQASFALLPTMTAEALDGDYAILQVLGSSVITSLSYISAGMQLSVECNEELTFELAWGRSDHRYEDPRYQRLDAIAGDADLFALCPGWPSGEAPEIENERVTGDVPTLLLAGQYDPITPPAGMDPVAAGLTTSYQFLFPHEGHGITPTVCGNLIVTAFIERPETRPDDSCIALSPEPPWVGRPIGDVNLVEFEATGVIQIRGLRPEGWIDTGFGSFTRAANVLDPTGLLLQPTSGFDPRILVTAINEQINGDLAEVDSVVVDGVEWRRYAGRTPQARAELMISPGADGVIALLVGDDDEFDQLRETVLLPCAAAARPTG